MTDTDTKYGDRIADHEWTEPEPDVEQPERLILKNHEIDVIYVVDPDKDMGYGRERYTAHLKYDDDTGEPYVLYVVEHKWKGNYWRDVTDWDFRDIPNPVRQKIAAKLPVDRPEDLEMENRLMDKGGESRWQKHHKPRMESMEADTMWAGSFLRDAMKDAEKAAETFDDGTEGKRLSEKCVKAIQGVIQKLEGEKE